ncbi:MAG: carbohydrate binding domain-containing protein [Opitutaceae bacterium]|jgi:hypothetical protein
MKYSLCFLLLAGLASTLFAGDLPLLNPGFEDGLNGWIVAPGDSISVVVPEAARSSRMGLQVNDQDSTVGSGVASAWFPAKAGKTYAIDFWSRIKSGDGVAVYLRFRDTKNHTLTSAQPKDEQLLTIPKGTTQWTPFRLSGVAPEGTAFVSIWVHSFSKNKVLVHFDDFVLSVSE